MSYGIGSQDTSAFALHSAGMRYWDLPKRTGDARGMDGVDPDVDPHAQRTARQFVDFSPGPATGVLMWSLPPGKAPCRCPDTCVIPAPRSLSAGQAACSGVKSAGVVCDGCRVIFCGSGAERRDVDLLGVGGVGVGGDGSQPAAGEEVEAEVAAAFGPFVVLFGQDGADEAGQGGAVGEDPDDV